VPVCLDIAKVMSEGRVHGSWSDVHMPNCRIALATALAVQLFGSKSLDPLRPDSTVSKKSVTLKHTVFYIKLQLTALPPKNKRRLFGQRVGSIVGWSDSC
jgi:hypothetical protein